MQESATIKGVHFDDLANGVYYTLQFQDGREVQTTETRVRGLVKKTNGAGSSVGGDSNAPTSLAQLQRLIAAARTQGDRKESLRLMKLLPSYMPKPVDSDAVKLAAAEKTKRLAHEAELRVQRAKDTVREARARGDSTDDEAAPRSPSSTFQAVSTPANEGTGSKRNTSDGQLLSATGFLAVIAAATLPMRQERTASLIDGTASLAPMDSEDRLVVLRSVYQLPLIGPIRRQAAAQRMGSDADKMLMAAFQGTALALLTNAVSDVAVRRGLVANLTDDSEDGDSRENANVATYMWELMLLVVQEAEVTVRTADDNQSFSEHVSMNVSRVCQLMVALQACDASGEHMASLWADSKSMRSKVLAALGNTFLSLVEMRTPRALDLAQVVSVLLPSIGSRFFLVGTDEQVDDNDAADVDAKGLPFDKLCTALGCGRPVISANVFKTLQRCTESELFKRVLSPSALSASPTTPDNDSVEQVSLPAGVSGFSIEDDERETVRRGACRVPAVLRSLLDDFTSHAQDFALDSHHHHHNNNSPNNSDRYV
jgi:hypothetical protein